MKKSYFAVAVASACLAWAVQGQSGLAPDQYLFVKEGASGTGTQGDPFGTIQEALDAAASNTSTTIYIAEGRYEPDTAYAGGPWYPSYPSYTFLLKDWVGLVGGWDGAPTGSVVIDPVANPVVLSGYLEDPLIQDSVYHVITVPDDAVNIQWIEGVTVTEGVALGGPAPGHYGGGMRVDRAEVYVVDCDFVDNFCWKWGGAIYNGGGEVYIYNSRFENNSADCGGAVGNGNPLDEEAQDGLVEIWNCEFTGNTAVQAGGALWTGMAPPTEVPYLPNITRVFNSLFDGNAATGFGGDGGVGGAVHVDGPSFWGYQGPPAQTLIYASRFISNTANEDGGAVHVAWNEDPGNPLPFATIVNSGFCSNIAERGGAVFVGAVDEADPPESHVLVKLINCTFTENEATEDEGGAVYTGAHEVQISNCILWGNTPNQIFFDPDAYEPLVEYSSVQGTPVWPGTGNLNDDPELITPTIPCDCAISSQSPMIDQGREDRIPLDIFDIDGDSNTSERLPDLRLNDRVVGQEVDIGAREVQNP